MLRPGELGLLFFELRPCAWDGVRWIFPLIRAVTLRVGYQGLDWRCEDSEKRVRKQKTDRLDAQLLLKLPVENNFPRIWAPSQENRDLRQLLWHGHLRVQMRTRIMNRLQALAMNEGTRRKKELFYITLE